MASDTAHLPADAPQPPPSSLAQVNNTDDSIMTNGDPKHDTSDAMQVADAQPDNKTEIADIMTKPIEHVNDGIAPMSDYISKDAPNLSHPTPPPEQTLVTSTADIDVDMAEPSPVEKPVVAPTDESSAVAVADQSVEPIPVNGDVAKPVEAPALAENENPLIRPREEDVEDDSQTEPAPKRNKVEEPESNHADEPKAESLAMSMENVTKEAATSELVASVETPTAESVFDTKPQSSTAEPTTEPTTEMKVEPTTEVLPVSNDVSMTEPKTGPSDPLATNATALDGSQEQKSTGGPAQIQPSVETPAPSTAAHSMPAAVSTPSKAYSTTPITNAQKAYLLEKFKNLKKTKHAIPFLKPVDAVALNIPNYPEVVKEPMDLSSMEAKLKEGQYVSAQAFVDDFKLIVGNTKKFNGDAHPITQASYSMEAYFNKFMESLPSSDATAPQKKAKSSPAVKPPPPPRRESRTVTQAASPTETFALQADGMPQIRRDSTINRPTRTIKPPQNRDVTYAKPKRKENQLELKFCEHVLDEISSHRHSAVNHVFQVPVDPVALNIPNYRSIIKHPMDLSTMRNKLKNGQYGKATEFRKDFETMIHNCKIFNPPGNPVRDLGISFERIFETVWNEKAAWERKHQPASQRASSASADESEAEPSEEEDEVEDGANETLKQLQKQLADMTAHIEALTKAGAAKPKKPKTAAAKPSKKAAAAPPAKAAKASKPKASTKQRQKPVTYDEKQEISQAVEKMDGAQVERLTQIITENCAKYRNMGDDMELEIDDLPNDVQLLLLKHVRSIFGAPPRKQQALRAISPDDVAAADDDDFEPETRPGRKSSSGAGLSSKAAAAAARKKHKPMGRKEQAHAIEDVKAKIASLGGGGGDSSQSPPANSGYQGGGAQSSGDEESEESEEE